MTVVTSEPVPERDQLNQIIAKHGILYWYELAPDDLETLHSLIDVCLAIERLRKGESSQKRTLEQRTAQVAKYKLKLEADVEKLSGMRVRTLMAAMVGVLADSRNIKGVDRIGPLYCTLAHRLRPNEALELEDLWTATRDSFEPDDDVPQS